MTPERQTNRAIWLGGELAVDQHHMAHAEVPKDRDTAYPHSYADLLGGWHVGAERPNAA